VVDPNARESARVCVGVVIGAKGVRGEVRIKSFTANPRDVGAYGPVQLGDRAAEELKITGIAKGDVVVGRLAGVADRDAAEALKGVQLFVARAALPKAEEGSYYHADLIGMVVNATTGETRGKVSAVLNFGAGDILEIARPDGDTEMIPFSAAVIAAVDMAAGTIVVNPLPGLFDEASEETNEKETT
jgi:16S rRNA processing protein RimM